MLWIEERKNSSEEKYAYFVMEYAAGGDLWKYWQSFSNPPGRVGLEEVVQEHGGDLVDDGVGGAVGLAHPGELHVALAEGEVGVGPAPEGEDDRIPALLGELVDEPLGFAQNGRRVGAGHASVGNDHQDGDPVGVLVVISDRGMAGSEMTTRTATRLVSVRSRVMGCSR